MRERERTSPREVRFKVDAAEKIAAEQELRTQQQKAEYFGVIHQTWSRIVRGDMRPGEAFIAAVVGSHPEDERFTFDTFFEVV